MRLKDSSPAHMALAANVAAFVSTTIHHLYGGLVDGAPNRLWVPVYMAPVLGASLVALRAYGRTGKLGPRYAFATISLLGFVLLVGGVHGLYAHLYKDLLWLAGGPARFYRLLNPQEHYPPDDLVFELSGVLDAAAGAWVAVATFAVLRASPKPKPVTSR